MNLKVLHPRNTGILEPAGALNVVGIAKFVAKEKFKIGRSGRSRPRISYMNKCFRSNLLGVVSEDVPVVIMRRYILCEQVYSPWIIVELGVDKYWVRLAHLWGALALQPNGEHGMLTTDGDANIFFVNDDEGTCWTVNACWRKDSWKPHGWQLHAFPVCGDPCWIIGRKVFSR